MLATQRKFHRGGGGDWMVKILCYNVGRVWSCPRLMYDFLKNVQPTSHSIGYCFDSYSFCAWWVAVPGLPSKKAQFHESPLVTGTERVKFWSSSRQATWKMLILPLLSHEVMTQERSHMWREATCQLARERRSQDLVFIFIFTSFYKQKDLGRHILPDLGCHQMLPFSYPE